MLPMMEATNQAMHFHDQQNKYYCSFHWISDRAIASETSDKINEVPKVTVGVFNNNNSSQSSLKPTKINKNVCVHTADAREFPQRIADTQKWNIWDYDFFHKTKITWDISWQISFSLVFQYLILV